MAHPPHSLGTLGTCGWIRRGFTAAIIGLAVKGAIKIVEVEGRDTFFGKGKGHFVLHEKETEPEELQPEEEALMMQLFRKHRQSGSGTG